MSGRTAAALAAVCVLVAACSSGSVGGVPGTSGGPGPLFSSAAASFQPGLPTPGEPGTGAGGGTGGGGAASCPAVAYEAVTEGCTLTLRAPADCATVALPEEFAWEADACHTPYYLQIAGSPPTENNYREFTVNTEPINALAWAEPVRPEYIEGLASADGFYHWRVCNAYGTGCSASRSFRLR